MERSERQAAGANREGDANEPYNKTLSAQRFCEFICGRDLARPYIANAQAKTAEVWWTQGFVPEEDTAVKKIGRGL